MAGGFLILILIDQFLRMLDAHADRKILGFHRDVGFVQHRERIARAVAERQHQLAAGDPLISGLDRTDSVGVGKNPGHRRVEADFAAQPLDFQPDIFDDLPQPVGTDVRVRLIADLRIRPGFNQLVGDLDNPHVLDARRQLAVGKSTRAAFAELHVALRIQRPALPIGFDVLDALIDVRAAFQHDRTQSRLG